VTDAHDNVLVEMARGNGLHLTGMEISRLVRHLAWRLTSLPADSSPVVSPLQGSDNSLTLTQGGARFTSLALGYPLSGFQPLKFESRYLGCYGIFENVSASATALGIALRLSTVS
jgi:hypothetical protein